MSTELLIQLSVLGLVVGFAAGLLGVGGGGLLVPILTGIYLAENMASGHAVHLALGTSMASIMMTTFSSARAHTKNQNVNWVYVKTMVPFIILGALSISFLIPILNPKFLALFFSVFMAFVSFKMLRTSPNTPSNPTFDIKPQIAGAGIGGVSTLVAIGGAALIVPYLLSKKLDMKKAIGTSAAIGLPIAISGTLGYAINGHLAAKAISDDPMIVGFVHLPTVLIVSIGGVIMAPLGAKVSNKLAVTKLKKIFGVLLICLSIKMLLNVVLN